MSGQARWPKNGSWRSNNQSKWSPKGFKIHPKSSSKAKLLQRSASNLHFFENLQFLDDFWSPKWSQNRRKSAQSIMSKKNIFLNIIFIEFSLLWPPKKKPKLSFFRTSIQNADFAKIIVFPQENCYFSGSEPPKIDQNSIDRSIDQSIDQSAERPTDRPTDR